MLRDQRPDTDLGAEYFDRLDTARLERQPVRRLEQLGYTVTLTPAEVACVRSMANYSALRHSSKQTIFRRSPA